MINTIEIQPHIVSHTIAKYLQKHYKIYHKDKRVSQQELHEFIRHLLYANKESYVDLNSYQAPGNE